MGTPTRTPGGDRGHSFEVEWMTFSYRMIAFYVVLALLLVGFVVYLISPRLVTQTLFSRLRKFVGEAGQISSSGVLTPIKTAHFVNLDGTVRIKKARSLQWTRADFNTSLEKGDFVQTGSDGVARIIFADGTSYVLKPDALIGVEESREDPVTRATKVSVQVTSGAVDLSTGRLEVPGSTSQVAFADAVATLNEESRAVVRNDPGRDIHEITVDAGGVDVTRGSTSVQLGQYEHASFSSKEAGLIRNKVIAPPNLLTPQNMELKLVKDPKSAVLDFSWTEVSGAKSYHLQISPSVMLSNFIVDKKLSGRTSVQVSGPGRRKLLLDCHRD